MKLKPGTVKWGDLGHLMLGLFVVGKSEEKRQIVQTAQRFFISIPILLSAIHFIY